MAHLVEVLSYKPEGRGFDFQWCHWLNPSGRIMALGSTQPLTEMNTRDISWVAKCGLCVRLIILPNSCADCPEIWELPTPWTLRTCLALYRDCFTCTHHHQHQHEQEEEAFNRCMACFTTNSTDISSFLWLTYISSAVVLHPSDNLGMPISFILNMSYVHFSL